MLLRPNSRLRQCGGRVGTGARGGGVRSAWGPVAPAGAAFATAAHPTLCTTDTAGGTPCGDGDAIRWWKDLVSGTWYEQATSGARLILRASGGSWYAEGGVGRFHDFTLTWPGGTNGTIVTRYRPQIAAPVTALPSVLDRTDAAAGDDYAMHAGTSYANNFRFGRYDSAFTPIATVTYRTYSQVSGADYRLYEAGVQVGTTQAASFDEPTTYTTGRNAGAGALSRHDLVATVIYADATSRAAGETWVEGFGL